MNSDINTNRRLFDLVRYSRASLHEEGLITDEEYAWLCGGCEMAKGQGSPSPRRLEDYDELRAELDRYKEREKMCETMDKAEKLALIYALQEIRDEVGLIGNGVSPREIVEAVRRMAANC